MTSPPPPLQVLLQTMQESLNQRMQAGKRRYLVKSPSSSSPSPSKSTADFASNDYLSLATNAPLQGRIESAYRAALMGNCNNTGDKVAAATVASSRSGSTGSRLISGNSDHAISLETLLLNFHHPPIISSSFVTLDCNERVPYEALLFNSGYTANLGLFGCIGQKHDAIFYDELVHASIHDGLKASRVEFQTSFKHNDIQDLVSKITQFLDRNSSSLKSTPAENRPNLIVAVESIYSMDGDEAPLVDLVKALESFNAYLIVDEAHSTGVRGPQGRGLVVELGLQEKVFARLHTFGKAIGCHGAAFIIPSILKEYLINYARPLIYSTFLPTHTLISVKCSYKHLLVHGDELNSRLYRLIQRFRSNIRIPGLIDSQSPIQGIIIPGNHQVMQFSKRLQALGMNVVGIRSPTVPRGKERIRICLHVGNSEDEIDELCCSISRLYSDMNIGGVGATMARL